MASDPSRSTPPRWVIVCLALTAVAWISLRFLAPRTDAPTAIVRALETVRVVASPDSGRFEIRQWPEALLAADIPYAGDVRIAGERLEASVEQANETLAALARTSIAHIERDDAGDVGLRLAGAFIPFPAADGVRLAALEGADSDHAFATLTTLSLLLEARLGAPTSLDGLDESVQRRELTRLHHQIRDALGETSQDMEAAGAAFRAETLEAVRRAGGPFLRRGRGVALETLLAALLGALLREAMRRRRGGVPPLVSVLVAPVAAFGAVAGLAGTIWLPVHSIHGLSPAFVPLTFAIGFLMPGVLAALSRTDRLFSDEESASPAPAAPAAPPAPAARPTPPPPAAPAFPRDPAADRAPFFRRRR